MLYEKYGNSMRKNGGVVDDVFKVVLYFS